MIVPLILACYGVAPVSPIALQEALVRKVGGKDISAPWPKSAGMSDVKLIPLGESAAGFGPRGELLFVGLKDGDWQDVAARYPATLRAQTDTTPTWRIKCFIVSRADILNHGDYLRPRRATLDPTRIDEVYRSLALASAAIETIAAGKLKVVVDVEVDAEEDFEDAAPDQTPFDATWLRGYVAPFINGYDFGAEDKVYRGPWDSVWVVHAGLSFERPRIVQSGMPVEAFPYFGDGSATSAGTLARRFIGAWNADQAWSVHERGFDFPVLASAPASRALTSSIPAAWLGSEAPSRPLDPATYLERRKRTPTAGMTWAEAESNPGAVPLLSDDDMTRLVGAKWSVINVPSGNLLSIEGAAVPMTNPMRSFDSVFVPGTESMAFARLGQKSILLVDAAFAPFVGPRLPESAKAHGWYVVGGATTLVFTVPPTKLGQQESEYLGLGPVETPEPAKMLPAGSVFSGEVGAAQVEGGFVAKANDPADRAPAIEINLGRSPRLGAVELFDAAKAGGLLDGKANPIFRFWVKGSNAEPLLIRFDSPVAAWGTRSARLFGRYPTPEDAEPTPAADIDVPNDGAWHEVTIDVRGLGPLTGQTPIRRITLESDPLAAVWGSRNFAASSVAIGAMTCEATTSATTQYSPWPEPGPEMTGTDAVARAKWAFGAGADQAANLMIALKDKSDLVKLNAAAALAKFKHPPAEPLLADILNTLESRVAQQGMLALKTQDTEYAWNAIRRFFEGPPIEAHRYFGVRTLGERKDPRGAGILSGSFGAKSWRTRIEGVKAIAAVQSPESDQLLMVFLQESNAAVRLSVAQRANATIDKVCKRLLYTAVNDSSEFVRAAAYAKLVESPLETYRAEGYKGVRDDSPFARIALLEALQAKPSEASRQALRIASADVDPRVRAVAALAWSTFPGKIELEELGSIPSDMDPRVQSAWAKLKAAKSIGSMLASVHTR